jgi:hypothetical protein
MKVASELVKRKAVDTPSKNWIANNFFTSPISCAFILSKFKMKLFIIVNEINNIKCNYRNTAQVVATLYKLF